MSHAKGRRTFGTHDLVCRPNPASERTGGTCTQPEEPEFSFWQCPAVGVAGYHSEGFGEEGEWLCQWCGARPFWPVWECRSPARRVEPVSGAAPASASEAMRAAERARGVPCVKG